MASYVNNTYVQFSQAINLNNLLSGLAPYLTINEADFFVNYFDIDTCNAQGLDNWGRILNISRTITRPDLTECFGFDDGNITTDTAYPQNFDNGTFWGGQTISTILTDSTYRLLLKFRYANLTTNGSLGAINNIMNATFMQINPTYKVAVTQDTIMNLMFTFNFYLTDDEYTILTQPDILPVPVGVSFTLLQGAVL